MSVGGAEHLALPGAYPQLQEVNVYLGWFGPFARPMQAGALVGSRRHAAPGRARGAAVRRRAAGRRWPSGPEAGTTPGGESWIAAQAFDGAGRSARRGPPLRRQLVRVHRRLHRLGGARRGGRAGRGRRRARAGRGVRARGARARLRARRAQPRQPAEPHQPGRQRRPVGSTPPSSVTRSGDFAGRRTGASAGGRAPSRGREHGRLAQRPDLAPRRRRAASRRGSR